MDGYTIFKLHGVSGPHGPELNLMRLPEFNPSWKKCNPCTDLLASLPFPPF